MRFDLQWLQDHIVDNKDPEELAAKLTACGLLVETREPADSSEIWDIEVTTNRPDAMNHRGLAREAATAVGSHLKPYNIDLAEDGELSSSLAEIKIEAPELCSRYVGRVIRNVKVGESPDWLKRRLEHCSVRPINTIVDATNYILLELGQPLHAFDLNLLEDQKIIVRKALAGEKLQTLDGDERALDNEMLVIADASKPIGIAGVMGGANSEINEETTDILLESAHFDALSVRRTARRLGMHTEASHRFERGCDPEICALAADAAASLIANLTGGTVCQDTIDCYPRPWQQHELVFDVKKLSAFAGLDITVDKVIEILEALEFKTSVNGTEICAKVPSFRVDIERKADLYEEVIRHIGYDSIPSHLPVLPSTPGRRAANWELIDRGRDAAALVGLAEVITYSFIDPEADALIEMSPLKPGAAIALDNPLASTQAIMRRSMLPGLLSAARESLSRGERDLALFEQGRVFFTDDQGVKEQERLALVISGRGIGWQSPVGFAHIKGVVEEVLRSAGFPELIWNRGGDGWLTLSEGAVITKRDDNSIVGITGLLAPEIAGSWDIKQPVYIAEINLDSALAEVPMPRFEALPRFPGITADMTIEHTRVLEYARMAETIRQLAGEFATHVELVARYEGKNLEPGKVRTTLRVAYRHPERSLTQEEVNTGHDELRRVIGEKLSVQLV